MRIKGIIPNIRINPLPLDIWIDTSVFPSEQGLRVNFKDITDKKLTESELIQFKKIIETSKECIGIIQNDKTTSYINPVFSEMRSLKLEEVKKMENALDLYADKNFASEVFSNRSYWIYWPIPGV